MAKKSKAGRIKAEITRLQELYSGLAPAEKEIVQGLIQRSAFMRVEMEDLEADLSANSWVEKFQQGNQAPYDRARPQGQTYNAINGNYQKIIKQLAAMLPRDDPKTRDDNDGFDDFVSGRDDL